MSENDFVPDPSNESNDSTSFDFSSLDPEIVPESPAHTPPNHKANGTGKSKWWQSKPKGEKKTRAKAVKAMPPVPRGGLKPALENLYVGLGMSLMPFDPHCAGVVLENAGSCAAAMDELAKTNPAVRRVLLRLVATSAIGTVIAAHAPILMAVAMHHIPAMQKNQEKMAAEMGEMFTRMAATDKPESDSE